jgi:hypothetical protein
VSDNPFQAPDTELRITQPCFRQGNFLVCSSHSRCPERCFHCNAPAAVTRTQSMLWHKNWLYLLLVVPFAYLALIQVFGKRIQFEVAYCQTHARTQRWHFWLGALLTACLLIGYWQLRFSLHPWLWVSLLSLASSIMVIDWRGLRVVDVSSSSQGDQLWIQGCGAEFLASLADQPEASGQART